MDRKLLDSSAAALAVASMIAQDQRCYMGTLEPRTEKHKRPTKAEKKAMKKRLQRERIEANHG